MLFSNRRCGDCRWKWEDNRTFHRSIIIVVLPGVRIIMRGDQGRPTRKREEDATPMQERQIDWRCGCFCCIFHWLRCYPGGRICCLHGKIHRRSTREREREESSNADRSTGLVFWFCRKQWVLGERISRERERRKDDGIDSRYICAFSVVAARLWATDRESWREYKRSRLLFNAIVCRLHGVFDYKAVLIFERHLRSIR